MEPFASSFLSCIILYQGHNAISTRIPIKLTCWIDFLWDRLFDRVIGKSGHNDCLQHEIIEYHLSQYHKIWVPKTIWIHKILSELFKNLPIYDKPRRIKSTPLRELCSQCLYVYIHFLAQLISNCIDSAFSWWNLIMTHKIHI